MRCKTFEVIVALMVTSIFVPDMNAQQWVGSGRTKDLYFEYLRSQVSQ